MFSFFFHCYRAPRGLHSFPTRRSSDLCAAVGCPRPISAISFSSIALARLYANAIDEKLIAEMGLRSEEHTSELQSRVDLVCRLLLERKNKKKKQRRYSTNYTIM